MKTTREIALNLSDISMYYHPSTEYAGDLDSSGCRRFYVGSYFCNKYFMKSYRMFAGNMFPYFFDKNYRVSLVVPSPMESEAEMVKYCVTEFLQSYCGLVDEVVVNDYAMLDYLIGLKAYYPDIKIVAGRLFSKNFRDFRYNDYTEAECRIFFPRMLRGKVDAIEVDTVSEKMDFSDIPDDVEIHMHYGLTYNTYGQVCEFSSAMKSPYDRFSRTKPGCGSMCMRACIKTSYGGADYYHIGKAVFADGPEHVETSRDVDRYIYFPAKVMFGE